MALDDFRVEGVGLISQVYSAAVTTKAQIVGPGDVSDHTVEDNYDLNGAPVYWYQPQPQVKIYNLNIANNTGSIATVILYSDTDIIQTIRIAANDSVPLGETVKQGHDSPFFVCNSTDSTSDGFWVASDQAVNIYAQYRVAIPRKRGD